MVKIFITFHYILKFSGVNRKLASLLWSLIEKNARHMPKPLNQVIRIHNIVTGEVYIFSRLLLSMWISTWIQVYWNPNFVGVISPMIFVLLFYLHEVIWCCFCVHSTVSCFSCHYTPPDTHTHTKFFVETKIFVLIFENEFQKLIISPSQIE